jgi:hypothetical protein
MAKFSKSGSTDWNAQLNAMKQQNSGNSFQKDERIYMPVFKEDGTASALLRIIEAPDADVPVIGVFKHYFQGPAGGWFKHHCPKTIGRDCPVCDDNGVVWNATPEGEQTVRDRKTLKSFNYYTNVLVVEDEMTPSNVGKVFLFRFGKKIHGKLETFTKAGHGIPWNPMDGRDLDLQICKKKVGKDNLNNYDETQFVKARKNEVLALEDLDLGTGEEIYAKCYPLNPFVDENLIKDYDFLKREFDKVFGKCAVTVATPANPNAAFGQPTQQVKQPEQPVVTKEATGAIVEPDDDGTSPFDSPDDAEFFNNMTEIE